MVLREKRHPVLSYLNILIRAYSHGEERVDVVARLCMAWVRTGASTTPNGAVEAKNIDNEEENTMSMV
jgi:hypothetical protein